MGFEEHLDRHSTIFPQASAERSSLKDRQPVIVYAQAELRRGRQSGVAQRSHPTQWTGTVR